MAHASAQMLIGPVGQVGRWSIRTPGGLGRMALFLFGALARIVRRPFRFRESVEYVRDIGAHSLGIVLLTSTFTGMVLCLQGYNALVRFGSESFVGSLVALSLVRELGPVLAALMVTARAGSAIAATLSYMRFTEQIDAVRSMGVDAVQALVSPRLLAALISVPLLTGFFDLLGIGAAYLFGVHVLGLDGGTFLSNALDSVTWNDVSSGMWKSLVFATLMAWISTYRGYFATGGAMGLGRATMRAVVEISTSVLIADYVMTALLF